MHLYIISFLIAQPIMPGSKKMILSIRSCRIFLCLKLFYMKTLGHGSGQLWKHTFQEGDQLTIAGKVYTVGETIPVTSNNLPQLLPGI